MLKHTALIKFVKKNYNNFLTTEIYLELQLQLQLEFRMESFTSQTM